MTPQNDVQTADLAPVIKTLDVRCAPERAFAVFTDGIASWWPLASHSVGAENATSVAFEPRVGGRLFETVADGTEHTWGTVLAWDPPSGFTCTWHPGREASTAQQVRVRFEAVAGGTRVTLTHTGWAALGDQAEATRAGYDGGWDTVFVARYGAAMAEAA